MHNRKEEEQDRDRANNRRPISSKTEKGTTAVSFNLENGDETENDREGPAAAVRERKPKKQDTRTPEQIKKDHKNCPCYKFIDGICPNTEATCEYSHKSEICVPAKERRQKNREAQRAKSAASRASSSNSKPTNGKVSICRKAAFSKCNNRNCKHSHDKAYLTAIRKKTNFNPQTSKKFRRKRWGKRGKAGGAVGEETEAEESGVDTGDLPYIEWDVTDLPEPANEDE